MKIKINRWYFRSLVIKKTLLKLDMSHTVGTARTKLYSSYLRTYTICTQSDKSKDSPHSYIMSLC